MKSRMRWAGHVACIGKSRAVYRVWVGKPKGKRPLGRVRHRREDNIKMYFQELVYGGMDWIDLAHGRDWWLVLVNAVMNLRVAENAWNFLSENPLSSQEGLCSMD